MAQTNEELALKLTQNGAALKPSSVKGGLGPWFYGSPEKPGSGKIQNIAELCGSEADAKRLYVSAMTYITNKPDLMKADQKSLQQCIMQSATLGLYPGVLGECDYLTFKGVAKFIPGYMGLIKLAIQSEVVSDISANVVYERDLFDYMEGTGAFISHRKYLGSRKDRGDRVCVYAIGNMRAGGSKFVIMTPEEVLAVKAKSMAKNSEYSPWNTTVDDEDEMWKKTAIKRLTKLLPKSTKALKFATAIALDNAAESPDDKDSSLSLPVYDEDDLLENNA